MIIYFDPTLVEDNPYQPRQHYDEAELKELAESLKDQGLIQKPTARLIDGQGVPRDIRELRAAAKELDPERFDGELDATQLADAFAILHRTSGWRVQLSVGHRRLRGWKLAFAEPQMEGFDRIPLDVDRRTDEQMATVAYSENDPRLRKGITPIEDARSIERMMTGFGWTQKQVAQRLGHKRPTITNKLRLLKLPEDVQQDVTTGTYSERTAQALYPLFTLSEEDAAIVAGFESYQTTPEQIVQAARGGRTSESIRHSVDRLKEQVKEIKTRKAREAEAKAKLQELGGDANGIPHLRTLPHDSYESVSDDRKHHQYVQGCSPECECRLQVIQYDGGLGFVCSNPPRHRGLKSKATKERKRQARDRVSESITTLYAKIIEGSTIVWNPALVRLIVLAGLLNPSASDIRETLEDLVATGLLAESQRKALDGLATSYHDGKGSALEALENVDMDTALVIVAGSVIRKEMRDHVEYGNKLTDFKRVMAAMPYDPDTQRARRERAAGRHTFSKAEIEAVAESDVSPGKEAFLGTAWWKDAEAVSPEYAALVKQLNDLAPWFGIMLVSQIDPAYGPPALEGMPGMLNEIQQREREVVPDSEEAERLKDLHQATVQLYNALFRRFGETETA